MKIATFLFLASLLFATGCGRGLSAQLDADSPNSNQDHLKIASYYSRQAVISRKKAAEQANRALTYEQLFGHDSDWVAGAQMLTQFYEDAAREQDRQANLHLELAGRRPSNR
ncbi:MAG: hypothetical protein CV088_07355 [Nitrospira sp. LK70]|nr:hypothetical protein [Nitrospira sp.]NGZ09191.1 hypothetical protein [Nitrospira sp. LK70]